MGVEFDLVTIDTPDTSRLATFWNAALRLHEVEREDGERWVVLADADGTRRIGLQRGPHRSSSIHLDLVCASVEFDTEVSRLELLGARLLAPARREPYGSIANMCDPDGNPFDICAYV